VSKVVWQKAKSRRVNIGCDLSTSHDNLSPLATTNAPFTASEHTHPDVCYNGPAHVPWCSCRSAFSVGNLNSSWTHETLPERHLYWFCAAHLCSTHKDNATCYKKSKGSYLAVRACDATWKLYVLSVPINYELLQRRRVCSQSNTFVFLHVSVYIVYRQYFLTI